MAFSSTVEGRTVLGDKKKTWGTFNAASVTGGDIDTQLLVCESLMLTHKGSAVEANVGVVNETYPCDGSAVTIVVNTSDTGYWIAIGHD